jgi:hypothetical protein
MASAPGDSLRPATHRRRRRLRVAVAVVLGSVAGVGAAAWTASPTANALGAHVRLRLHDTGGRALPPSGVAPALPEAVVATEDERFYRHHGIDLIGVLRALPYDVVHLSFAQGASTITEQVGKLLYLGGNDHSPWRKLEDAALALKLESRYSKQQILAAYLNSVYFGQDAYGAWAASERYFGIPPSRLDTAQATLLAGLIQAPSAYDPFTNPAAARARQVEVLRSLVRTGFLTAEDAGGALARPLRLRGGTVLAPVRGLDLAPGPAFVWWQLALGLTVLAVGLLALLGTRLRRSRPSPAVTALRLLALVATSVGAATAVRSFRSL